MIRMLPEIVGRFHERGITLDEVLADSTPLDILAWIVSEGEIPHSGTTILLEQLSHMDAFADAKERAAASHRIEQALLQLLPERERIATFLDRNAAAITAADLDEVADILGDLAYLLSGDPDIFELFIDETFVDAASLNDDLRTFALEPYVTVFGLRSGAATNAQLAALSPRAQGFLELAHGLAQAGFDDDLGRLKQIFAHVVVGDFDAWRAAGADGAVADPAIDATFWEKFNVPHRTEMTLAGETTNINHELEDAAASLLSGIASRVNEDDDDVRLEQRFVWEKLKAILQATSQQHILEAIKVVVSSLHQAETGTALDDEARSRVSTLFGAGTSVDDATFRKRAIEAGTRLARWIEGIQALQAGLASADRRALTRALTILVRIDREYQARLRGRHDPIATPLAEVVQSLKHRSRNISGTKIVIEDVADWETLIDVGRLHPEMIDCLSASGDPKQTRALIDLLGSRNKRVVIVRDAATDEILSRGIVKVRRDGEDNPTLHLERPLGRRGLRYEAQMLEHLRQKREAMRDAGGRTTITRRAKPHQERERGIELLPTGSFGKFEYVEDLFGVRESGSVRYCATVAFPTIFTPSPSGPGTGRLSIPTDSSADTAVISQGRNARHSPFSAVTVIGSKPRRGDNAPAARILDPELSTEQGAGVFLGGVPASPVPATAFSVGTFVPAVH